MQEVKQTKENTVIKYKAIDNTLFNNKEECVKYEDTLRCYLNAKYKSLVYRTITEEDLTSFGSSDYHIDLVTLKSEDDVKTLMQYVAFKHPYIQKKENEDIYTRKYNLCNTSYINQETLLVGRGDCEESCWPLNTLEGLTRCINSFKSEVHE